MLIGLALRSAVIGPLLTRTTRASPRRSFHRTSVTMVEGHQCHRVAHAHRQLLLGHAFAATSPNQRFVEGAAAVNGKPLTRIEVHGKNLFYFFGDGGSPEIVHIHFGMAGAFKTSPLPGPEPTETTRLRLVSQELGVVALLSAMTVQHGGLAFYEAKAAALGQDPLREDADPETAWARISASKKPIGLLLMDQAVISGVGNIYRAEILFKAGVHPEQPGSSLSRAAFDEIWRHSVLLLQRGFQTGSILTVDPEEAKVLGKPWTRRYIYNHESCGRCGGAIASWDMAGRTCYACPTCQPLAAGAALATGRAKALAGAKQAKEFPSRCAPDDPADLVPSKMTLPQLRASLSARGLPTAGRKAELAARLAAALAEGGSGSATAAAGAAAAAKVEVEDQAEGEQQAAAAAEAAAGLPTPSPRARARGRRGGVAQRAQRETAAAVSPELYEWGQPGLGQGEGQGAASPHAQAQPPAEQAADGPSRAKRGRGAAAGAAAAAGGDEARGVAAAPAKRGRRAAGLVAPGTVGLGRVATAAEAAAEKAAAGEGRNVEHVALHLEAGLEGTAPAAAAEGQQATGRQGRRAGRQ